MAKTLLVGGLAVALLSAAMARAEGTDDSPAGTKVRVGPVQVEIGGEPVKLGQYWLGVECYPVRDTLRAQLGLPADQGLVVEKVLPDGPAAKAGIERHDILMTASKKPLKKIQDLIDATEAAKGEKMTMTVLHQGKEKEVGVTPAKRPAGLRVEGHVPPGDADWDTVTKWMERVWPGEGDKPPIRFHFLHPGAILPRGAATQPPLPEDMTVTITKKGASPAKIAVARGDQKWEVTEEDLSKLPDDVRPHVERMLGRLPIGAVRVFEPGPEWPQPPEFKEKLAPRNLESRVDKRMEEMGRRIDQLRKTVEELREKRAAQKGEKPEKPKAGDEPKEKGEKI